MLYAYCVRWVIACSGNHSADKVIAVKLCTGGTSAAHSDTSRVRGLSDVNAIQCDVKGDGKAVAETVATSRRIHTLHSPRSCLILQCLSSQACSAAAPPAELTTSLCVSSLCMLVRHVVLVGRDAGKSPPTVNKFQTGSLYSTC